MVDVLKGKLKRGTFARDTAKARSEDSSTLLGTNDKTLGGPTTNGKNSKEKDAVLLNAGPPSSDLSVNVIISQKAALAGGVRRIITDFPRSRSDPGAGMRDSTVANAVSAPCPTATNRLFGEKHGKLETVTVIKVPPEAGPCVGDTDCSCGSSMSLESTQSSDLHPADG
jgi:hypothetical protein